MALPDWVLQQILFDPFVEIHDLLELHSQNNGTYGLRRNFMYDANNIKEFAKMAVRVTAITLVQIDRRTDGEGDDRAMV